MSEGSKGDDLETTVVVTIPGGQKVRPEYDLDFGEIADIATRAEVHWSVLLSDPLGLKSYGVALRGGKAANDIYRACCAARGVPTPDPLPAKTVFAAFDVEPVDLPATYEQDGTPKGEQQATT